ncbi:hypothetical protein chiPu_0025567, partial [Chiloscyllium punctatum]|nr:hypothetical protein [Chiloscyllium punctatum]
NMADRAALELAVKQQGELVRKLKADQAPPDQVGLLIKSGSCGLWIRGLEWRL